MSPSRPSFLFVCTGNICRSPLAEAAMRAEAERRGLRLDIDSAGTGSWHAGEAPDPRARATARRYGLDIDALSARQIEAADFERFTHILALDASHLHALRRLAPAEARAKITLLLDHLPGREGSDVDDPYFGPASGFEITWRDVSEACRHLAARTLDGP
ncbi:low molecular weight protein-tyrosine-phosphatase [Acidomonas methanolica]|uniref:protein-tyrosine-phosphatase n=1 Tax=Acidomonas methanolica NBRC 104435 TaxID=1231351 RepID=A0A023D773_ACIMT|nr:low molecular weight protein-tyrosine-phosphatase [Acidomonas methanolica]MBU2654653.1 low molecular weight phosphotyrosine protein phosphatase [Acidomonas methanolica]TCS27346.1 protein-tyrosine phosphatase [Acidomonas methanolica]GAJ29998.1 phosphotyrosine protein phosphatase [Acidomonas methanolica NBRC 104435]GBQ49018.1 protein-tyrosine-phosphatase [Acidomonas methanolica]GEK99628.1 phosphotyrosine protein phosphatase [Acidomonas methanolica NBRC 104435]